MPGVLTREARAREDVEEAVMCCVNHVRKVQRNRRNAEKGRKNENVDSPDASMINVTFVYSFSHFSYSI